MKGLFITFLSANFSIIFKNFLLTWYKNIEDKFTDYIILWPCIIIYFMP
jgi:hypothetical protein